VTQKRGQIVFIDTPGLHDRTPRLAARCARSRRAVEGIDILLLIVDATHVSPHTDSMLIRESQRFRGKQFCVE